MKVATVIDVKLLTPKGPGDRPAVEVRISCGCGCGGGATFSGPLPIPPNAFGPESSRFIPTVQVAADALLSEYKKRAATVAAQN